MIPHRQWMKCLAGLLLAPACLAAGGVELVPQTGHSAVRQAVFSPDGKFVLTGGEPAPVVVLWDRSGLVLRHFRAPGWHLPVGFTPDGRQAITFGHNSIYFWDIRTGKQTRTLSVESPPPNKAVLSPDGALLLAGGNGKDDVRAHLWDVATGERRQTFAGAFPVESLAVSRDGRRIAIGVQNDEARLFDARSGELVQKFQPDRPTEGGPVGAVAFSPDGRFLVSACSHLNRIILWDIGSGREVRRFSGNENLRPTAVSFSPDGKWLLTSAGFNTSTEVILWDVESGKQLRTFAGEDFPFDGRPWTSRGHTGTVAASSFSPDGTLVLTSGDSRAILWEAKTGRQVHAFAGKLGWVGSVAVDSTGSRFLVNNSLWSIAAGRPVGNFTGPFFSTPRAVFSPKGDILLVGRARVGKDNLEQITNTPHGGVALCDRQTGEVRLTMTWPTGISWPPRYLAAFTPDGKFILTASAVERKYARDEKLRKHLSVTQVQRWDADDGTQKAFFEIPEDVYALASSPSGTQVLLGEEGGAAVCDSTSGEVKRRWAIAGNRADAVCWRPDGRQVALGCPNGRVLLRNAPDEDGLRELNLEGHEGAVTAVTYSPDGKTLLSASADRTARLWDAATGKPLRTFAGHDFGLTAAAFLPDGRRVLTGSADGTVRLWDATTGEELARLVQLDLPDVPAPPPPPRVPRPSPWTVAPLAVPDWLVTTPEGLFDGSAGGRQQVAYRVGGGLNVAPVDRFFKDFYHPGLLAELFQGKRPRPEVELGQSTPPAVKVVSPAGSAVVEESQVTLEVEATDQGGGVQGPWLIHNGARVLSRDEPQTAGKVVRRRFTVALVEGENRLEVKAANRDGSQDSEPAILTLRYLKRLARPELFLLAVGVNRYADETLNLKFARADAEALADLFQRRGKGSLYADVHRTLLLDDKATRAGIRDAFQEIARQARPQDVLVVFLAGHGTTIGQRYYFIPHDFRPTPGKTTEEDVRRQGLPDDVLGDYLAAVPALKRLLILDTCASGAAGLIRKGRNPFAFRGAIETLGRSQGAFTLAAAAASEEAQEVEELGHGVLSYALLAGMKAVDTGPLKDEAIHPGNPERVASVLEWFNFASGQVPRLTKKYFGREQDVQSGGQGNSFPLLPVEEK
jgi:WD40 repeat protein